ESIVRLLLDGSTDMEIRSQEGLMLLHCSIQNGYNIVISLLINRGADKTARTVSGQLILHFA
ncbi:uncharacterized protein K444DRAFT_512832, partial [Hyaloscypha bicolor E]